MSGCVAWVVSLAGSEVAPGHPAAILCGVVVAFSVFDPTTARGRKWLQAQVSLLSGNVMQVLAEILTRSTKRGPDDKGDKPNG